MFQGFLPNDISIYATTTSNATDDSFAYYCPNSNDEYTTCLRDLYSVSWWKTCMIQWLNISFIIFV